MSVRTMIFDVEPLVAPWNGSQESLDQGIARILGDVRTVPSVRVVMFATNSARRPSAVPARDGLQVRYLAPAGKPLPEDGPYLLSFSIWLVNLTGPLRGEADAGSRGIGPGYAVEPASPGVARRGAGRP